MIDGITYYNINSSHINSPALFYEDLFNANHSSIGGISLAKRWLMLGAGLINTSGASIQLANGQKLVDIWQSWLLNGKSDTSYDRSYIVNGFSYSAPTWKGSYVETSCKMYTDIGTAELIARFSDFSIVALMPENSDHYISTTIENTPTTTQTVVPTDLGLRNDTAITATLNASVTNSYTQGFQTSFNHSATYSYKEGLKIGTKFGMEIFGVKAENSIEISAEFQQSFTDGWSKTDTESKTRTENNGVSVTAQPYTTLLLKKTNTDTTTTTRYNCPVGVSYKVTLMYYPSNILSLGSGYEYTFGGNAVSDLNQRALVDGVKRTDPNSIDWETFLKNNTTKETVKLITTHIPISATGATTKYNSKTELYQVQELAPIYPLRYIAFANESNAIKDMQIGNYFITDNIKLNGYNEKNGPYYNFKAYGKWIVTDSNGQEIKDGSSAVVLEKDSASGQTKCRAVKGGKAYLRFIIDDKSYPMQTVNSTKYVTKDDLTKTAVMEINVDEEAVTYEVSGNYIGFVDAEGNANPENIEGDEYNGYLAVHAYDKTGKEITASHIWDQKEMSGIILQENGFVKFSRAGRYHVRAMSPSRIHYSEWKEINAEYMGGDGDTSEEEEIPDEMRVDADADTFFVIEGNFVGGVTSADPEKIEGLQKLKVKAYDSAGKEIPLRYTWESETTDGITITGDGTVSFTKTGLYHVRIKSGEYYSDWVAISAEKFAPARFTRIPTATKNTYDGTAKILVNADDKYEGGIRLMYGLSSDDVTETTEYSSEMPEAVEVGNYHVWCKVTGDGTHSDSTPVYIAAKISAKEDDTDDTDDTDDDSNKGSDASDNTQKNPVTISSSGGGCNGGMSFAGIILFGLISIRRRK